MYNEDKAAASDDKSREFGVLGDVLRELQREEMEHTETCQVEISETSIIKGMLELITEINTTLKEIAETQKKILEEVQKKKTE
ncbi:hypothetical protein [Methanosarcina sp.]|uniref:hypothetical protein n=1 Tax=Methanosarcina sp. TaxID=2213 RepID=UPI002ABCD6F5|nr:hypothetical protein [Methanosarcina sp.]MDY9926701.1 hypothetical protein [Methanosarcina sp.]